MGGPSGATTASFAAVGTPERSAFERTCIGALDRTPVVLRYICSRATTQSVRSAMTAAVVVGVLMGALVGSLVNVLAFLLPLGSFSGEDSPTAVARLGRWDSFREVVRAVPGTVRRRTRQGVAVRFPILEVGTGVLFGLTVLRFGVSWVLPAYLYLAAMAVLLAVIDVQHQRLPNSIVLPSAGVGLVLLTVAALSRNSWDSLLRAVLGAAVLFALYLVLALISPAGMGMGDVKLAGVLGLFLGFLSWRALILATMGGFILAALVGAVLLVVRRVGKRTLLPFGPSMLVAALAAVLLRVG